MRISFGLDFIDEHISDDQTVSTTQHEENCGDGFAIDSGLGFSGAEIRAERLCEGEQILIVDVNYAFPDKRSMRKSDMVCPTTSVKPPGLLPESSLPHGKRNSTGTRKSII